MSATRASIFDERGMDVVLVCGRIGHGLDSRTLLLVETEATGQDGL